MTDRYAHLLEFLSSQVWAIVPEKLAVLWEVVGRRAAGARLSEEEIRQRLGYGDEDEMPRPKPVRTSGVAILPLYGFLCPKANMITEYSGGTSLEAFAATFRTALADTSVGSIVLDVYSGGGSAYGAEELWSEIFNARKVKPIKAVVNPMAGSAAYWVASAAEEIIVTPSGDLGSIGVYVMHEDISKHLEQQGISVELIRAGQYKAEGNPYEPLSEDARAYLQAQVDTCYQAFVKSVAKGRGVSSGEVLKNYGQGRMVLAREAVSRGMADRIGTLEETVAKLAGKKAGAGAGRAAEVAGTAVTVTYTAGDSPEQITETHIVVDPQPPAGPPAADAPPPVDTGAAERERARAALDIQELG